MHICIDISQLNIVLFLQDGRTNKINVAWASIFIVFAHAGRSGHTHSRKGRDCDKYFAGAGSNVHWDRALTERKQSRIECVLSMK